MKSPKQREKSAATTSSKRRRRRPRPVPRWLREQNDLDEMARRRCLMILTVLSGERSVSDVIEETGVSRQLYYQLEERALRAMLSALLPSGASESVSLADSAPKKIAELEAKVTRLERDKRRSERLLFLTRKMVRRGPMTTGAGRPRKTKGQGSTSAGRKPSPGSKSGKASSPASSEATPPMSVEPSMPKRSEVERSAGTGSWPASRP
jgi:hypothetical protein